MQDMNLKWCGEAQAVADVDIQSSVFDHMDAKEFHEYVLCLTGPVSLEIATVATERLWSEVRRNDRLQSRIAELEAELEAHRGNDTRGQGKGSSKKVAYG